MSRTALTVWLFCSAAMPLVAGDWPQFLGPDRTGISAETGLIDAFLASGPKVVWRVPGGVGMSNVAIAGEQLVTLVQKQDRQWVVALDTKTGKEVWATDLAPDYKNSMGDGPRATPTINDGTAFVYTGEGILAAVDMKSGDLRWSHNVPEELKTKPSDYGMSCSPLVTATHVIVAAGADDATIAAFDRASGKLAWTAGEGSAAGYSSPALLNLSGEIQLVVFAGNQAIGVDPATGKPLWTYPYETDFSCNTASPVAVNGNLFLSAGENHGCVLLKVPAKAGGKVEELWSSQGAKSVMRNEWQTSVLIDGYLYGFDNVGSAGPVTHLTCVDAKTGERVWQKLRFGKGNLIAADGKLWCSTMDGDLVLVRATPDKFEELARASVIGETRQAPVIAGGRLYLRDGAEIVCLDITRP
jgi:outer membrane protein assembly factor BamB